MELSSLTLPMHERWSCPFARHYGLCGRGGIALLILNFETRWRWGLSFTPRFFNPEERIPGTIWWLGREGPWAGLDACGKERDFLLLWLSSSQPCHCIDWVKRTKCSQRILKCAILRLASCSGRKYKRLASGNYCITLFMRYCQDLQ